MSNNFSQMKETLLKLKAFPDSVLEYGKGVSEEVIMQEEQKFKFELPSDFKQFYADLNGFSLMGEKVYSINQSEKDDLFDVYQREHHEVVNPMPEYFLPFCPNGRGDHYCIDLRTRNEAGICKIVFWQWDYSFHNMDDIDIVNNSFSDWLTELVIELEQELD